MTVRNDLHKTFGAVDWLAVGVFTALMLIGWLNIYSASYDAAHPSIFDFAHRQGMQLVWVGISLSLGVAVVLVDDKYWHILAFPLYWVMLAVLLAVAFVGKDVNGARSWIMIGPVALQPTELMKFATVLALARYMSNYSFSIRKLKELAVVGVIIAVPAGIIILQNDTGSALVYVSLLMMLYREGLNRWIYVVCGVLLLLFVFSFLLEPLTLLILLVVLCALCVGADTGQWRRVLIYLSSIALASLLLFFGIGFIRPDMLDAYHSLLICSLASLPVVVVYAYRNRFRNVYMYVLLFCTAVTFSSTIDYVFHRMMQTHQQKRILDLLGIESDLKGWGYNVNQSKIAIGSGGFIGKGFLHGTQTRYNFVPEQSTDFIFCTVGEEWGFVGSLVVLGLFCVMIMRLMRMGERQHDTFGRVYCYGVASVFLFHVVVNVGMTIGLMPVIGIPLPLISYGGSSLIAFTLLFFVAVRLDSNRREGFV